MIDVLLGIGVVVLTLSALIYFHAYTWRRESRWLRARWHHEDVAFWQSWDAATKEIGLPPTQASPAPPPDDSRDWLRALGDIPHGWVFLARVVARLGQTR